MLCRLRIAGILGPGVQDLLDAHAGLEPDIEFYENARKVVTLAEIEGLRVIPTRTYFKDIKLSFTPEERNK